MTEKTIPHRPPKPQKVEQVETLSALLAESKATILTDYRGLTVSEITDLRRRLQQAGAEYHVIKNTLFSIACSEREEPLKEHLKGPVAVAFAREDPVRPAKAILDFIRDSKKGEVKVALIEGQIYDAAGIQRLSLLPSREVLIGQVLGAIQAPLYNLVGTLQSVLNDFVWTIQAVHDKQAEAGS